MLQALLASRFEMKMHRDSKEFPVYSSDGGERGLEAQRVAAG